LNVYERVYHSAPLHTHSYTHLCATCNWMAIAPPLLIPDTLRESISMPSAGRLASLVGWGPPYACVPDTHRAVATSKSKYRLIGPIRKTLSTPGFLTSISPCEESSFSAEKIKSYTQSVPCFPALFAFPLGIFSWTKACKLL
jgi:hypothetical protein